MTNTTSPTIYAYLLHSLGRLSMNRLFSMLGSVVVVALILGTSLPVSASECTTADYQWQNECTSDCGTVTMMLNGCSHCDLTCYNSVTYDPATVSHEILADAGEATISHPSFQTLEQIPGAVGNIFVQIGNNLYECVEIVIPGGSAGSGLSCVATGALVGAVAVSIVYPPVGVVIVAGVVTYTTVDCAIACNGSDPDLCQQACANSAAVGVVLLGTVAAAEALAAAKPYVIRPGTPVEAVPVSEVPPELPPYLYPVTETERAASAMETGLMCGAEAEAAGLVEAGTIGARPTSISFSLEPWWSYGDAAVVVDTAEVIAAGGQVTTPIGGSSPMVLLPPAPGAPYAPVITPVEVIPTPYH